MLSGKQRASNTFNTQNLRGQPLPWAVFAVAAGLKFWCLTSRFSKHLLGIPSITERLRKMLEQIWEKDQQVV